MPPFNAIFKDTVRSGRIPGQSDHIFNASIGYEKKGFSARLSVVYQGESLGFVGQREELDGYTDEFFRWDMSMKQKLGKSGVTVFMNLNNISNTPEREFLGSRFFPTRTEYFGWTGDLGVNYKF